MANQSLGTKPVVLLILAVVLLMALTSVVQADMAVIFYNNLKKNMVMMHCASNVEANLPAQAFAPTQSFWAFSLRDKGGDYRNRNWGGTLYWCEFQATGKPTTNLYVFMGTGGSSNQPCGCTGLYCHWTIKEEGLTCGNGYIHKWG